jgi:hypothetical protein
MPTYFRHGHWIVDEQSLADAAPLDPGTNASDAGKPQYVITLSVTPQPQPLPPASSLPQIGGLTVFRARYPIANREVHLQQLGWFDSLEAAQAMLPLVERTHPGAFVEQARTGTMTSLDDTSIAEFEVLRRPPVTPPPGAPPLPPIPPLTPAPEATPAGPSAPAAGAPGNAPAVRPPAAPEVRLPAREPFAPPAVQRYAIQLVRQPTPIDMSRVARPSIFQGYTLYRVQSERDGYRTYGLRLGFFTDAHSARLVADYVKSQFPRCAAVPVSEREFARVQGESKREG